MKRVLTDQQLREIGVAGSPSQLFRDRRCGLFPAPIKLGNRNGSYEVEVQVYQGYAEDVRGKRWLTAELKSWLKEQKENGVNAYTPEMRQEWKRFAATLVRPKRPTDELPKSAPVRMKLRQDPERSK